MRKRYALILSSLLVAIGLIAFWLLRLQAAAPITPNLVLTLKNLPAHYCPEQAAVVVQEQSSGHIVSDKTVNVVSCQKIDLNQLFENNTGSFIVMIKLRWALAFSLTTGATPTRALEYAPQVGDVNDDNVIDRLDEVIVSKNLFLSLDSSADTQLKAADIDGDNQITMNDLTLVRMNQGVGVSRPDQKLWTEVK